jgi:hypothetical protein
MQKHEGPRRDRETEERSRQRILTLWLSLAILLLGGLLAVMLVNRM